MSNLPLQAPAGGSAPRYTDRPIPGFYRCRLVKGGPWVAVRIYVGFGKCPDTGDVIERGWQLRAERENKAIDPYDAWLSCAGQPITESEFQYLEAMRTYAVKHAPHLPEAKPRERINIRDMPAILPPH